MDPLSVKLSISGAEVQAASPGLERPMPNPDQDGSTIQRLNSSDSVFETTMMSPKSSGPISKKEKRRMKEEKRKRRGEGPPRAAKGPPRYVKMGRTRTP